MSHFAVLLAAKAKGPTSTPHKPKGQDVFKISSALLRRLFPQKFRCRPAPTGLHSCPISPLSPPLLPAGEEAIPQRSTAALQVKMKGHEHDQLTVRLQRPPHHDGRPPGPRDHIPRMGRKDSGLCNPEIQIEPQIYMYARFICNLRNYRMQK